MILGKGECIKSGVTFAEILITGPFAVSLFWGQMFRNLTDFPGSASFVVPSLPPPRQASLCWFPLPGTGGQGSAKTQKEVGIPSP